MEWIDVNDYCPSIGVDVLITDGDSVWIGSLYKERYKNSWGQAYNGATMVNTDKITGWMPLPKPYVNEEEYVKRKVDNAVKGMLKDFKS